MIPKIIHYCWFGQNPLPKSAKKCIKSWKKHCPDYKIVEWNESNYDISKAPLYVRQAYEAKKWAFVSDYVRLWVVYKNGGIYLDTDVELIKNLDSLLPYTAYFGFEDQNYVATGLGFGSVSNSYIIKELMDDYCNISFFNENGTCDTTPCTARNTNVFLKHGLKQNNTKQILDENICILPSEFFSPKSFLDGIIRVTENTYSIHHYDATWLTDELKTETIERWKRKKKRARQKAHRARIKGFLIKILGEKIFNKLRQSRKII